MDLNGKVALITGAGRGIGKSLALTLGAKGCRVALAARTAEQIESAAQEIVAAGGEAVAIPVDLAQAESAKALVPAVLARYGRLDILVNNAAVLPATPVLEITEEEWDTTLAINLKAPFLLAQAALRVMVEQRSGYIINISSTAALAVSNSIPTYGITKKAIIGLSEALYEAGKRHGVKVSTIYPGMTNTEMLRSHLPAADPTPWMLPEDVAGCIVFLLEQNDRVVVHDVIPWATGHDEI